MRMRMEGRSIFVGDHGKDSEAKDGVKIQDDPK